MHFPSHGSVLKEVLDSSTTYLYQAGFRQWWPMNEFEESQERKDLSMRTVSKETHNKKLRKTEIQLRCQSLISLRVVKIQGKCRYIRRQPTQIKTNQRFSEIGTQSWIIDKVQKLANAASEVGDTFTLFQGVWL